MRYSNSPGRESGFSLVEVMVALIIICVGLLGIAKLEALVLSSTGTSRVRALVALQAESLADAMHADRDFWDGGSVAYWNGATTDLSVSVTESSSGGTKLNSGNTSLQAAISAALPGAVAEGEAGDVCLNTACNTVQLAGDDLAQWSQNLAAVLQNSTSSIACSPVNSVVTCTITVQWNENTVAANSQEAQVGAPTAFQQQTYTLVVEP